MASSITGIGHLQIPLEKILNATNNFSDKNIIGKGGFGNVYRGKLDHDGKMIKIAARRLDRKYGHGDVEFWKEVSVLSSLQDTAGIVSMIGFCDEKGEKVIVNQHYRKGSLLMYINGPTGPSFTWKQRLTIAEYLFMAILTIHSEMGNEYIIHRNINSSTILLDDHRWPILSGFEFSIKIPVEQKKRVILSEAIGTKGYIDPAIEKYGGVTYKSDIYSVGLVLFELICGRNAFEENRLLAPLAKFHYENGTLKDIIHPDLLDQVEPKLLNKFSQIAYSCLEDDPALRPDVEQLLEQVVMPDLNEMDENDKEDPMLNFEDVIQISRDMLNKSRSDYWKVEKLEHLRLELTNIYDSPYNRDSRPKYGLLVKKEIEYYDREHVSFIEHKNTDNVPKKHHTVAVKTLKYDANLSLREIEVLGLCKHPNIQSFLGFYDQDSTIKLFYEYVSFKYLYEFLNDVRFTWGKRLKACIDVAHGINYLHNEMEDKKMVIHGDICSRNIEMDDNGVPKIVGFENSVIIDLNQDVDYAQVINEIDCDKYYLDSEYAKIGKLKRESDVFSFGVLMLEILCGEWGPDITRKEGCSKNELINLARRWFNEGTIKKKVSPIIQEEYYGNNSFLNKWPNIDSLDTFISLTEQCLAENQNQRPDMKVVIKELQKALALHDNHKDPLRMSFSDIKLATQDFDRANCIGGGGFGQVYKGRLAHTNNGHSTIVVKKLDKSQGQGERQYYNELQILYKYNHENVISLIGFSNETDEKLIVYEHASKGSLDNHLNNASLTWRNRLKICINIATALNFLHGGVQKQDVVIHRDIKTANILLFDDWKAKVGDFGLSLISPINKKTNFTIDHPCGTRDYVDPMYLKSGILTVESDVYSFGVALFEILCGRATYTIPRHKSVSLLSFIKYKFENGKEDDVVFKAIKEEIVPESLSTFLNIVYKCLDEDRENRPTMKDVLVQLEKALEFQLSI